MRQSLAIWRAMGAELNRPYCLALLAEACGRVVQAEEGLVVLDEAVAAVDKTKEHYYEAEQYRLKGQLTLQKFQVPGSKFQVATPQPLTPDLQAEEVEEYFHKAIDVARHQ